MTGEINVHIYPSTLINASRIFKITETLVTKNAFSRIIIVGIWSPKLPERETLDERRELVRLKTRIPFLDKGKRGFLGKIFFFLVWYIQVLLFLSPKLIKCVNAHSLSVLPLCAIIKKWKKCFLVYDTHELETEVTFSKGVRKTLSKFVEKQIIRYVDETIVVSESIKKWYIANYRLPQVWVVRNIPSAGTSSIPISLKNMVGIPNNSLLFLYLGYVSPGRGIQQKIKIFSNAKPDRHILFIGDGALSPLIQYFSDKHTNIHWLPAVPPNQVVSYAGGADVGFCPLEKSSLSDFFSLPNKLFEYLLAGLPVLINDFPDQRNLVEFYDCGWVLNDSIESSVSFVNNLTNEMISEKRIGVKKAQKTLSWENEAIVYLNAIESMLSVNAG